VGPRTGLDDVEKRNILSLLGLESDPSAVGPVARRSTQCGNPALDIVSHGKFEQCVRVRQIAKLHVIYLLALT
jgi:hypothetical protein